MRRRYNGPVALTDRERILTAIVSELAATQLLGHGDGYHSSTYDEADGRRYVHFAYDQTPVAGDLVLAKTGRISEWKIGWYVGPWVGDADTGALIREIGSRRVIRYGNESFVPIRGLSGRVDMLEAGEYQFDRKVRAAFDRGGEHYSYRYGGVEFDRTTKERKAIISVREPFGGNKLGQKSVPFTVTMPWSSRTSVWAILRALKEGGYGTRKYTYEPDPDYRPGLSEVRMTIGRGMVAMTAASPEETK